MNKRIVGVIGIKSIMSNFNADFNHQPKSLLSGQVYASDKSLKHAYRSFWNNTGEMVFGLKSAYLDEKTNSMKPRDIKERYEYLFGVKKLNKEDYYKEVLMNLMTPIDIRNFGLLFAESKTKRTVAITGAVQFSQGMNKYEGHSTEEQYILSPFRDGSKEDASHTTLGKSYFSTEAHYMFDFKVNPHAYQEEMNVGTTGYNEDDYLKFKEASMKCVSMMNTASKSGCDNELAIFVETDINFALPSLAAYITFKKGEDGEKDIIDLTQMLSLLKDCSKSVNSVEIYYDHYAAKLVGEITEEKIFNIYSQKEI